MSHDNLMKPEYGPLYGLRVVVSGVAAAGPFTGRYLGDLGAEVIKIETPGAGDPSRAGFKFHGAPPRWDSLDRNMMSIEMDLNFEKKPESKQVFIDLMKQCDVWVNSIPGIGKHGASDELALEANPRLIINHITGFGLPQNGGDPAYLGRACMDPVGQAFSTLASLNGMPDGPYITANPVVSDIITSILSVVGILSARYNLERTGKGQVIDTSMFEASAFLANYHWAIQLNGGGDFKRPGPLSRLYYPFGYYECGDGEWVSVGVFGLNMWKKFVAMMGTTEEEFGYQDTCCMLDPAKVAAMDIKWKAWLAAHTADEAEKELCANRISSSKLMKASTAFTNSHYNARHDFIKLKDQSCGTEIDDFATTPKFSGTPIDYSRYQAGPMLGQHTDAVLSQVLGYSAEQIAALKAAGAVAATSVDKK